MAASYLQLCLLDEKPSTLLKRSYPLCQKIVTWCGQSHIFSVLRYDAVDGIYLRTSAELYTLEHIGRIGQSPAKPTGNSHGQHILLKKIEHGLARVICYHAAAMLMLLVIFQTADFAAVISPNQLMVLALVTMTYIPCLALILSLARGVWMDEGLCLGSLRGHLCHHRGRNRLQNIESHDVGREII